MKNASKSILITGAPGIGKMTLVRKLFAHLASFGPVGFYTEEIRKGGGNPLGIRMGRFEVKKADIGPENTCFRNTYPEIFDI